jgi:hypothetical protein
MNTYPGERTEGTNPGRYPPSSPIVINLVRSPPEEQNGPISKLAKALPSQKRMFFMLLKSFEGIHNHCIHY